MGRIDRLRTFEDIGFVSNMFSLMDAVVRETFRITDEQYDKALEEISDEEISALSIVLPTFAEKREMIRIINKYVP